MKRPLLSLSLTLLLASCSSGFRYAPYAFGPINEKPIVAETGQGYEKKGGYGSLSSMDYPSFPTDIKTVLSFGNNRREVLPSTGKPYLTVIPVDFSDAPASSFPGLYLDQLKEAFFGNGVSNQYVSLAEYYDKTSFHRLQVQGEVTPKPFRSEETYATLKAKSNASQTKAALTRIYLDAIDWYNAQDFKTRDLHNGDAIYFVYLAPYAGMDGTPGTRSSMMWAFTINDPAPICWSSYYMMHPREDGSVDAHTFIHEFGHMLGLKDYYDQNSFAELSPCSPLGRMDMMDCSLGEHGAFSKMLLNWETPRVINDECQITLRPSTGNGDFVLLPFGDYNGTAYDEYVLLDFYAPSYLNAADATLRSDPTMSLMRRYGVRAYHVDARLGLFDDRSKAPKGYLTPESSIGTRCLDFYADNSGMSDGTYCHSSRGFLIQALESGEGCGKLRSYFIASDHDEDLPYGDKTARLRNVLFEKGKGLNPKLTPIHANKGGTLPYGFTVDEVTSTYAKISIFKA